ncbi:endonuclease/exonuclease/phosphatase family [Candidatus Magnetomorum sp. HK-1]|nr:endonuclease/exonuclease/phosphatase family [Candidatus Magnetomorum sp. HK-1]
MVANEIKRNYMITFLFWNIQGKDLQEFVANIATVNKVDIIILAECKINAGVLLSELNRSTNEYYYSPCIGCRKILIFLRFPVRFFPIVLEDHRLTIRHLTLPCIAKDILVAATHFSSKQDWEKDSQTIEAVFLASLIKQAEKQVRHCRTVLVGDLNMNPFESGVAGSLKGVMSRDIALKGTRQVQFKRFQVFYNPIWNFWGDATPGPPGTFYNNRSEHVNLYWHMLDQVLVRPDLLDTFDTNDLQILSTDGNTSFLSKKGLPNQSLFSDHLPILFKMKL